MNTHHTPESFFDTVYYELFYDSDKFLFSPANTPIFQLMASKKSHISEERIAARNKIKEKAETYTNSHALQPDMSFAIGYGSSDDLGTTSGQITSIKMSLHADDVYASWIGAGLGIGIGGGQNLLIDHEEILWAIYEGWTIYRKFVNQTDGINNKIETWNGVWLKNRFSIAYNPQFPDSFRPVSVSKKGEMQMERPTWIEIFSMLSFRFGGSNLTAYVYQFSKMNTTIGFIQINLPEIKRLYEIYPVLFPDSIIEPEELMKNFETAYGFLRVCQNGVIGLRQLEPKDVFSTVSEIFLLYNIPKIKGKKAEKLRFFFTHKYSIYKSWVIAMLNNLQLSELSEEVTTVFIDFYQTNSTSTRNKRFQLVKTILESKSRTAFIKGLSELLTKDLSNEQVIVLKDLKNQVVKNIPSDNLAFFIALLTFDFYYKKISHT